MTAFLDTHAAFFLWEGRTELFEARSAELLERSPLAVSPLVRLELTYLREVGKILPKADQVLADLSAGCGVAVRDDSTGAVIERAMGLSWTRDPFDRLLVATAELAQAPLITRDARIHQHFDGAVW